MAGLTEFYCGWNEPSHASQFKWLEYTFKETVMKTGTGRAGTRFKYAKDQVYTKTCPLEDSKQ